MITGGTGFIGRHLVAAVPDYFSHSPVQVRILTRKAKQFQSSEQITYVQGDITAEESLKPIMDGVQYVFHLAGRTGVPKNQDDARSFWQVNVEGTKNIARIAAQSNVEVMVNLSSSSVYGDVPVNELDETAATNPVGVYGTTKLVAENVAETQVAESNMRVISVRPSNVFGENSSFNVLLTMMRAIKNRRFFLLRNTDEAVVNYLYVGDLVDAVIRLVLIPDLVGTFNINTPELVYTFATGMAHAIGTSPKFVYLPYALSYTVATFTDMLGASINRPLPITRSKIRTLANTQVFSPKKLQLVLDDWPQYGVVEGIERLVQFYRDKALL